MVDQPHQPGATPAAKSPQLTEPSLPPRERARYGRGQERGAMKILLIEDDREAAEYLVKALTESGYIVDHAAEGRDGLFLATSGTYDSLIVDRMLPGMDGLSIIAALRAADIRTPTLILSALGAVDDRVKGLRAGGDDYLVKPYAFSELLARLEALLRRGSATPTTTKLRVADLEMDLLSRAVKRDGQAIDLLPREFRLLEYLMRHAGQVVTRTMLLESVWDYHFDPQTNVIDVHISRLRQKIDKGFAKPLLHTIRGAGYSLRVSD
jgi:two-component system OmpR family response regulator